jgi:hypothetical protein
MGLITDLYTPPNNGFDVLVNAIDRKYEIEGRSGSVFYNFVDYPIFYLLENAPATDFDYAVKNPNGEVYKSAVEFLGRSPDVGDKFVLYKPFDFTDSALYHGKDMFYLYNTPIVEMWDVFELIDVENPKAKFIGNLKYPHYRNFYSTVDNDIVVDVSNEITVSGIDSGKFHLLLNTYLDIPLVDFTFVLDVDVVNGTIVVDKELPVGVYNHCCFRAPVYSSYYYENLSLAFIHAGN